MLYFIAWFCMMLHGVAWCCMILHCIAWYCMTLRTIMWFYMMLHGIAGCYLRMIFSTSAEEHALTFTTKFQNGHGHDIFIAKLWKDFIALMFLLCISMVFYLLFRCPHNICFDCVNYYTYCEFGERRIQVMCNMIYIMILYFIYIL